MKGAILYGILLTWILGMLCQVTGLYVPTPDAGFYSLFPSWGHDRLLQAGSDLRPVL